MDHKKRILVVDDERFNIKVLGDELTLEGYDVISASNGEEALELTINSMPDAILLDIIMPGMDGYEVCRKIKEMEETKYIPVIMLTALTDTESKYNGLKAGAVDFLNKPVDMLELSIRLKNALELKAHNDFLRNYNEELEEVVRSRTEELREAFIDSIYRLTLAAEQKDKCTASHLKRVSHYTRLLARCLGLSEKEADVMFHSSPMHDVGKIGVPDSILLKPGKLSEADFEIMKAHTVRGGEILSDSKSDYLKSAASFALYHHENWDGTGYPYGLRGEGIPLEGRIMLMADRYDAIRSARPYKKEIGHKEALIMLTEGNERTNPDHFDPAVLAAFGDNHLEFARIYEQYRDI